MVLDPEILRQTLYQVRQVYQWHNHGLFGGKLKLPLLEWSESDSRLGSFSLQTRTLRLSVALLSLPWGSLVEVLKHEMAHQYVFEVLGVHDEGPHGPTFTRVCRERGVDARSQGMPEAGTELLSEQQKRQLSRIENLLALATSDNQNEAEVAMATARRLMLKYNLAETEAGVHRDYSFRHLGRPTGRRMGWQRVLANILSEHFFVEILVIPVYRPQEGKRGSVLEACGTRSNLAIASYVHDFLETTAERLWRAHKKQMGIRANRDRQSFLYGVMCGFRDKLEREAQRGQQEGLVWMGDPSLQAFFRRRHPHIRNVGHPARYRQEAYSAGHRAGGRIVLHRGVEAGSSRGAPRLLGAGGGD